MGLLVALRLVGEILQRCVYLAEYEQITATEWDLEEMKQQACGYSGLQQVEMLQKVQVPYPPPLM